MMIAVSQIDSLWNVGIKTAAAQNMVAIGFMNKLLGKEPTWLEWFIAAAPFAALMSVVLYFVLTKMMPSEVDEIKGGQEVIAKMQKEMGKISFNELKLMFICVAMLFFLDHRKTTSLNRYNICYFDRNFDYVYADNWCDELERGGK